MSLITTIGYGAVFPATTAGRAMTVGFSVFGISCVSFLFRFVYRLAESNDQYPKANPYVVQPVPNFFALPMEAIVSNRRKNWACILLSLEQIWAEFWEQLLGQRTT